MIASRGLIVRLALAALVLFAQHVALAHRSAHALDREPLQSPAADSGDFHSELCVFHGDFESLHSGLGSAAPQVHFSGAVFGRLSAPPARYYATAPVIPASRGPPPPCTRA
ncbi:MAG TPA: hypothetical protein VMN03_01545 [Burkholderiales bacterium]|nr:hypothetical protein [Burkholderiales bacterium]